MEVDETSSFELYSCEVCFNNLLDRNRKPRTLRCNHTFCSPCLRELLKDGSVTCPKCRQLTQAAAVEDLPVNFDIAKMKEREEEIMQKKDQVCLTCFRRGNLVEASVHCKTCERNLCAQCCKFHNSMPAFRSHVVEKITKRPVKSPGSTCEVHKQPLQYICLLCMEGACVDCVFENRHGDHKEYVADAGAGQGVARQLLVELQQDIGETCMWLDKLSTVQFPSKATGGFQENQNQIYEKLKCKMLVAEIRQLVCNYLSSHNAPLINISKELRKVSVELCQQAVANQDPLPGSLAFVKRLQEKLEKIVQEANNLTQSMISRSHANAFSTPVSSGLTYSGPAVLLSKVTNDPPNINLNQPSEIDTNGNCVVFSDHTLDYVQVMSLNGRILGKHYPLSPERSYINGVQIRNGNIYIGEEAGLSIIPLASPGKAKFVIPNVQSIACIAVDDKGNIYIGDYKGGSVARYDPETDETVITARGFRTPEYLSIGSTPFGTKFAVTDSSNNRITIFNHEWFRVGELIYLERNSDPRGTAWLPNGHLLVADRLKNQIVEYKNHKDIVRVVLAAESGIRNPRTMAVCDGILCFVQKPQVLAQNLHQSAIRIYRFERN